MTNIDWNDTTIDPFAEPDTPDPDATPEADAAPEAPAPDIRDVLTSHALRKLVADHIYASIKEEKKAVMDRLVADAAASGATTWTIAVTDVDGETHQIAKATLAQSKPSIRVTDQDDLVAWLEEQRPDLVETIEHPATEAWTEKRVAAHTPDALLAKFKPVADEDGTRRLITDDGEFVPGVTYNSAPAPSSYTMTWGGKGSPGKVKAMDLLASDSIAGRSLADMLELDQ